MSLRFSSWDLPLRLPKGATSGYGTALVGVPHREEFLITWMPDRGWRTTLTRVHVPSGRGESIKGIRGLLRAGRLDEGSSRIWLLATHGLHEADLHPFELRREVGAGIPKYNQHLFQWMGGRYLGITIHPSNSTTVVSTEPLAVVKRIRVSSAGLAIDSPPPRLCSFLSGVARAYGEDLSPAAKPVAIPELTRPHVLANGCSIFGLRRDAVVPEGEWSTADFQKLQTGAHVVRLPARTFEEEAHGPFIRELRPEVDGSRQRGTASRLRWGQGSRYFHLTARRRTTETGSTRSEGYRGLAERGLPEVRGRHRSNEHPIQRACDQHGRGGF